MMNRRNFINYLGACGIASVNAVTRVRELIGASSESDSCVKPRIKPEHGKPEFRRIALADYKDHVYGARLGKIVGAF